MNFTHVHNNRMRSGVSVCFSLQTCLRCQYSRHLFLIFICFQRGLGLADDALDFGAQGCLLTRILMQWHWLPCHLQDRALSYELFSCTCPQS